MICDIERDPLHREIGRSQGALVSRYRHDAAGRLIGQQAWRAGPVAGAPARRGWEALGDDIDPLTGIVRARLDGPTQIARRYRYDGAGNLLQIDDQRSGTTRYAYDAIGRLTGAQQPTLNERFAFDPAHNLLPPQAREAKGASGSSGLIRDNRLEVFEDKRYHYDAHGNLLEKRIGRHTTIEFCWDVEHQLTRAEVTRKGATQVFDYAYDAFGRRIEKRDGFGRTLFTWDGNRLLAEQSAEKQIVYLYEAESFAPLAQLVNEVDAEATKASPATEARAVEDEAEEDWQPRKTHAAFVERMLAEQRKLVAQAHGNRASTRSSEAVNERPPKAAGSKEKTDKVIDLAAWRIRYYHNDHLGTPRELTAEDGRTLWRAAYKAWGNVLKVEQPEAEEFSAEHHDPRAVARAEPIAQPLRFQGQYYDEETGLHYNRFRYYDPDIGRFISQDPIGLSGGENLYQYAPNPTIWIDQTGLARCCPCGNPVSAGAKLTGPGDQLGQAANWIKEKPGTFDMVVHGDATGFWVNRGIDDWVKVDHRSLATYMKKNGWKKGQSVRLISCGTGALPDGVAKNLANKLGANVSAPSDTVWLWPSGNLTIGQTATPTTGSWNVFTPGKP